MNDVPATASVAVRAAPVLAATVKLTVPLPVPDAPAEMVTNVALLVAVQVHPVPAVIGIVPVPPAAANVEALIAPAATVHVGVVGLAGVSSFEQPNVAMRIITAGNKRREVIMPGSIHRVCALENWSIRRSGSVSFGDQEGELVLISARDGTAG